MGCLKLNYYTKGYKGVIVKMSRTNRQNRTTNTRQANIQSQSSQLTNEDNSDAYIIPKSTIKILTAVISVVCTISLGILGTMAILLLDLRGTTERNSTNIDSIMNDTSILEKVKALTSTTCIGTDSNGNQYIAEDLINQTILLTYTEDDKEIYFLGQYNENYNWNGFCVTNVYYLDGSFFGICESNFENGKRLDYKSFYLDEDENDWIYSDRVCDNEKNVGVSITYSFNYEKIKNFTNTNARITDILYADEFIEENKPVMITYYYGNTSDLLYNDNSGTAYFVSFFNDGTVKTLYQGNFVDGKFNDHTGNAWYIVKEKDTKYMYAKGNFENNTCIENDDAYENPIDLTRINEILQGKTFNCKLKWADS